MKYYRIIYLLHLSLKNNFLFDLETFSINQNIRVCTQINFTKGMNQYYRIQINFERGTAAFRVHTYIHISVKPSNSTLSICMYVRTYVCIHMYVCKYICTIRMYACISSQRCLSLSQLSGVQENILYILSLKHERAPANLDYRLLRLVQHTIMV